MDFYKFEISTKNYENANTLAKFIHNINKAGNKNLNLQHRLDQQGGVFTCTLQIPDGENLESILTKLPISVGRVERVSASILFDIMYYGRKCFNGIYPTSMCQWVCAYIKADAFKKFDTTQTQSFINEFAKKHFDYHRRQHNCCMIPQELYTINNQQYYPVVFSLEPKRSTGGPLTNHADYLKDLKANYICFYKAIYDYFQDKTQSYVFKTDICGNRAVLSSANKRYEDLAPNKEQQNNIVLQSRLK